MCTLLSLASPACNKKSGTPAWQPQASQPEPPAKPAASKARSKVKPAVGDAAAPETEGSLRFVSYNLENWLTMERSSNGQPQAPRPKPESEKTAVVKILARVKPDVLGVCEIGSREDLADLQARLKAAGLDLPNVHYTGGADPVRHLALLTSFPITTTGSIAKSDYRLNGRAFAIERGVLDATLAVNGRPYHFLGAHLKSKRDSTEGDQGQMRAHEAMLIRDHIEAVMKAEPDSRLIVYGDFNDTKASPALKSLEGTYNQPDALTPLPLKDRQGQTWTHDWAFEDIYSRIDWILVNRNLKPEVNFQASHVVDDPEWVQASDHRPVLMLLK